MPLYEYLCKECKKKFELIRPFSKANEEVNCPQCQKKAERIISTCYCMTIGESGTPQQIGGSTSCSSCSSGNCASCKN
ncbi:MAG: zinc ribbon domain-containing protein [Dehalococcoidales bacterium]|nr:zinc ribbon domain-containing protein [Dehalococcoidales bacterium]